MVWEDAMSDNSSTAGRENTSGQPPLTDPILVGTSDNPPRSGLSGYAALGVMSLAALTVGIIIAILAVHIWIVEGKYKRSEPSEWGLTACQDSACAREVRLMVLESEAQGLRTDRIRTAQLSRLFVFIVSEVAGFALLVMGAVLVFDRVIAKRDQDASAGGWSARSEFPGLLMCLFGAVMVIWSVQAANRTAGFFEVFDRPVFLPDLNWYRNELGIPSGSRPNSTPEVRSAPPLPTRGSAVPDATSESEVPPSPARAPTAPNPTDTPATGD